jgi:hypothetical protein
VDVLAYRAEEGRRKRRNASGSRTQATIRGYPNGETQSCGNAWLSTTEYIGCEKKTQGIETSQYLEEKKTKVIPKVVASEIGRAQTSLELG